MERTLDPLLGITSHNSGVNLVDCVEKLQLHPMNYIGEVLLICREYDDVLAALEFRRRYTHSVSCLSDTHDAKLEGVKSIPDNLPNF